MTMSNYFDKQIQRKEYDELMRRINPRKVLEYYGVKNDYEVVEDNGEIEVQHSCLIDAIDRHHSNGDQNPSARMNLDKKLYICFSYGGGDIIWFIKIMEQTDDLNSIKHVIEKFLDDAVTDVDAFTKELDKLMSGDSKEKHAHIPVYNERILRNWRVAHPYMVNDRGISLEAHKKLQIGYDSQAVRVVFPHFWEGKLVGWQKRAVPPSEDWPDTPPDVQPNGKTYLPKYKNSPDFPKSQTIYNYDLIKQRGCDTVVVVESPMSVAKAETLTDGTDLLSNVVSTFGAKVNQAQIDALKDFKHVFVYMDSDKPGFIATTKLVRGLHRFCNVMVVQPEPNKDMGDYWVREEVLNVIDKAEPAFMKLAEWDDGFSRNGRPFKQKGTRL